ncbi:hypothetical protein [Funiculus sociatus]|uniref:hypothetical protein n=1 Tax=Funiculus sociatus TaxID=450527 RepID=UPI00329963DD
MRTRAKPTTAGLQNGVSPKKFKLSTLHSNDAATAIIFEPELEQQDLYTPRNSFNPSQRRDRFSEK